MPRRAADDDGAPRRRRRAGATAKVEVADKRGLVMRALLYSPKDLVAGLLGLAAASAIIVNALYLQSGPHPAPMFGSFVAMPTTLPAANPLPRPRPIEADVSPFDPKAIETRSADAKAAETKSADGRGADQRYADPLADLVKSISGGQSAAARPQPTAAQSGGARRVAAVQRALTDYGYGQLKPTGMIGPDTQAAIQKFERERKLPVTGQVSDRLVRELAIVIGHPID
ncbi:peptidoglycan-binding domain-containing protein [Bradyrhizobium sp. STM 3557]|uniref:peptidoglycan-binding domain-containing protein n=1 Tax=Bradyrhizobium sp. STM 3557 TaxID=578920 RepID=UPI00388F9A78